MCDKCIAMGVLAVKHTEAEIALTSLTVLSCTTDAKIQSVPCALTCCIRVRLLTYKGS